MAKYHGRVYLCHRSSHNNDKRNSIRMTQLIKSSVLLGQRSTLISDVHMFTPIAIAHYRAAYAYGVSKFRQSKHRFNRNGRNQRLTDT